MNRFYVVRMSRLVSNVLCLSLDWCYDHGQCPSQYFILHLCSSLGGLTDLETYEFSM